MMHDGVKKQGMKYCSKLNCKSRVLSACSKQSYLLYFSNLSAKMVKGQKMYIKVFLTSTSVNILKLLFQNRIICLVHCDICSLF